MRFDSRAGMRLMTAIHEFWYRMTDGWIGNNFMGTPMLLLTTTGRKTGRKHTTPLVYLEDGDDIVVIASNGGSDRDPQWWLNLKANPQALIQVRNKRRKVQAEAAAGEERSRLWAEITRRYGQYRQYERRTSRVIPVVRLMPASVATAAAAASERPSTAADLSQSTPNAERAVKPARRARKSTD